MYGTQEKEVANINKSFNTNSCFLKSPINGPMVVTGEKSRLASYSQSDSTDQNYVVNRAMTFSFLGIEDS